MINNVFCCELFNVSLADRLTEKIFQTERERGEREADRKHKGPTNNDTSSQKDASRDAKRTRHPNQTFWLAGTFMECVFANISLSEQHCRSGFHFDTHHHSAGASTWCLVAFLPSSVGEGEAGTCTPRDPVGSEWIVVEERRLRQVMKHGTYEGTWTTRTRKEVKVALWCALQ